MTESFLPIYSYIFWNLSCTTRHTCLPPIVIYRWLIITWTIVDYDHALVRYCFYHFWSLCIWLITSSYYNSVKLSIFIILIAFHLVDCKTLLVWRFSVCYHFWSHCICTVDYRFLLVWGFLPYFLTGFVRVAWSVTDCH